MELALCLAPGLDVNGVTILYKAAKPTLQVSTALLLLLLLLWTNSIGPGAAVGGSARIACGCDEFKRQHGLLHSRCNTADARLQP